VSVRRPPLCWDDLEGREPPEREWIIKHWIPKGHTTLLAGRPGIGKTLLAQHIATANALGRTYLEPLAAQRVLTWAGEDDEGEFWRRQLAISKLAERQMHGSSSTASSNYLPRLAKQFKLLDRLTYNQFCGVMRDMLLDGELTSAEVGKYSNLTSKMGLVLHK
jgi:energy-coupling factor transporter ATP-binding protein EcfA2